MDHPSTALQKLRHWPVALVVGLASSSLLCCQFLSGTGVVSGAIVDAGAEGTGAGGSGGAGGGAPEIDYVCVWAKDVGEDVDPEVAMTVDGTGAVLVTGSFRGNLDFGDTSIAAGDAAATDAFVAKLNGTMGQHVWSHGFGDDGSNQAGRAIGADGATLFVAGTYQGALAPPGSCASLPPDALPMAVDDDVFLLKLTPEGDCVAGTRFGFSPSADGAAALSVDASNVLLLATAHEESEVHVVRYDPSLAIPSSCSFVDPIPMIPSVLRTHPRAIVSVGQTAFLGGGFNGTMTPCVGMGSMVSNKSVAASEDVFLGALATQNLGGLLDPSLWTFNFGDQGDQSANALATDAANYVYAAGAMDGTLAFGNAVLNGSPGGKDVFVAQVRLNGSPGWAFRYGDFAEQSGQAITYDPFSDTLFLAGNYRGTLTFGGDPLPNTGFSSAIYLAKLRAANGSHVWSRSFGDGSAAGQQVKAVRTSLLDSGVVLAGTFTGTLDFGAGCTPLVNADATKRHLFVVKLVPAGM